MVFPESTTLVEVEEVVVVFPAFETLVVLVEAAVVVFPELEIFELTLVAEALLVVVVVGALTLVPAPVSATFQVLKRPLESRTTSRATPSDQTSRVTLPHVTKWPLVSRTTQ